MQVEQVMTSSTVTCRPQQTLDRAVHQMAEHGCGAIPVVDDDGRVEGIVTDRDAVLAAHRERCALDRLHVSDAMTPDAYCCAVDEPIERAEELMREHRVRRLPVVDSSGRLAGMLSLSDIARSGRHAEQVAALLGHLAERPDEAGESGVRVPA